MHQYVHDIQYTIQHDPIENHICDALSQHNNHNATVADIFMYQYPIPYTLYYIMYPSSPIPYLFIKCDVAII